MCIPFLFLTLFLLLHRGEVKSYTGHWRLATGISPSPNPLLWPHTALPNPENFAILRIVNLTFCIVIVKLQRYSTHRRLNLKTPPKCHLCKMKATHSLSTIHVHTPKTLTPPYRELIIFFLCKRKLTRESYPLFRVFKALLGTWWKLRQA